MSGQVTVQDKDGKKTTKTSAYTYDLLGRITKEKKTGSADISYTYDSNNNRKQMTVGNKVTAYKYNKNDELLRTDTLNTDTEEDSVVIYKNDKNGNQLATVNRYEIPSDKKDSSYVDIDVTLGDNRLNENVVNHYNAMNQLTQTLTKNYKVSFNYDAEGLRTSKTVNGEKTVFVWDGDQLVMELSESGKVQKRYVRGNDLVYADKGENTKKQYYVTDPHGNVVQLTDESGKVTKIYEYDSFGNEVNPDSKDDNPFRYCGEYYDKETEEIYLRARYYQPEVGRFLTRDTYTGEDDEPESLHLYTYCENDGVNCFDPSGHKKVDWTNKLNKAMREHALNFNKFLIKQDERVLSKWYIPFYAAHVEVQKMEYFCKAVKTGGKWDLKSKKKWKFKRNNKYYYNGIELRADDPGNIHFGYVGSVYLPVEVLCTGAGIYQIKTDYTKEKISKMDIQKIMQGTGKLLFGRGDDPRDQFMIRYGNALFHKDILKSILKVTG